MCDVDGEACFSQNICKWAKYELPLQARVKKIEETEEEKWLTGKKNYGRSFQLRR